MTLWNVSVTLWRRSFVFFWDSETTVLQIPAHSEHEAIALVDCQIELTRRITGDTSNLEVDITGVWQVS